MDGSMAEILLFVHGQFEHIPKYVPKLSEAEARDTIPAKLQESLALVEISS